MKILKQKSDVKLVGAEPKITKDGFNYYILAGKPNKNQKHYCVFEGTK